MDYIVVKNTIKDGYDTNRQTKKPQKPIKQTVGVEPPKHLPWVKNPMTNIGNLLGFIIFAIAFYLSYSCNLKQNMSEVERITRATIAGIFGTLYIIVYLIFWSQQCNK